MTSNAISYLETTLQNIFEILLVYNYNYIVFKRTETKVKTVEATFQLGKQFRETTIDDRLVDSTFEIISETTSANSNIKDEDRPRQTANNQTISSQDIYDKVMKHILVQTQVDSKGRESVISRTICDEKVNDDVIMNVHMTVNGVQSSAIFKKVS